MFSSTCLYNQPSLFCIFCYVLVMRVPIIVLKTNCCGLLCGWQWTNIYKIIKSSAYNLPPEKQRSSLPGKQSKKDPAEDRDLSGRVVPPQEDCSVLCFLSIVRYFISFYFKINNQNASGIFGFKKSKNYPSGFRTLSAQPLHLL